MGVAGSTPPHQRACIDLRPGDEDFDAATFLADPDSVRAIEREDTLLIAALGGPRWVERQRMMRERRREVLTRKAGELGAFLCDQMERAEGWKDAPGEN